MIKFRILPKSFAWPKRGLVQLLGIWLSQRHYTQQFPVPANDNGGIFGVFAYWRYQGSSICIFQGRVYQKWVGAVWLSLLFWLFVEKSNSVALHLSQRPSNRGPCQVTSEFLFQSWWNAWCRQSQVVLWTVAIILGKLSTFKHKCYANLHFSKREFPYRLHVVSSPLISMNGMTTCFSSTQGHILHNHYD